VSVALVDHIGPWTAEDVEALPDSGDHARYEVYEGGVLVVSPAPAVGHQRASYWLHRALAEAAIVAGADVEVLEAVNLGLPGGKLLVPDVVVVAAASVDEDTTRIPSDAVAAVVEIVSPSTISIDRAVKPALYAEAGIPVYWRVELHETAKIVVCTLRQRTYVTHATFTAGTQGRITRPYPVTIDPRTSPAAQSEQPDSQTAQKRSSAVASSAFSKSSY
jgi:Uma2 family endonuclease